MKTNRKKMLLSSIAMLLVALVALGSATYAWFTLNKKVTADQMKVTVAAAKGLQITGNNGSQWGKTYHYSDQTATLSPASLSTASSKVSEKTVYAPAIDVDGKWSSAAATATATFNEVNTITPETTGEGFAKSDYMAAYEFGVKSSSGELKNVTQTLKITTGGNVGNFARVALLDQSAAATVTYGNGEGATPVVATYGNQTSPVAFASKSAAEGKSTTAQSLTAFTSGTEFNVTTSLTATETAHYYTLLVWFEGEDADCTTANASGDITIEANFSIA